MQIKTIKTVVSTKLNEWIETITDLELKNDLKKNVLVSGGSIVSMLLNEPVNDFDIYINDIEVLKRLAQYYVVHHQGIILLDGRKKSELEKQLQENYGWLENAEEEVHSAYAISLRNLKDNQIKLFFEEKNGGMRVNEDKEEKDLNYAPMFFSPNAISLSNQLQIVLRFHGNNEEIHKTFDFIHATNYFTFKEALESILTKQLRYQGSLYPLTSIIRMKKFIKRGWNINAGEILKIMFQISELDLTNPDVLEEQLIGVDVAYFSKLIEILIGVESCKVTSHYLNTLIDRVFDGADSID
jgi:hypothetical protein